MPQIAFALNVCTANKTQHTVCSLCCLSIVGFRYSNEVHLSSHLYKLFMSARIENDFEKRIIIIQLLSQFPSKICQCIKMKSAHRTRTLLLVCHGKTRSTTHRHKWDRTYLEKRARTSNVYVNVYKVELNIQFMVIYYIGMVTFNGLNKDIQRIY